MTSQATHQRILERLGWLTVVAYAIVPPEIQAKATRYRIACSGTDIGPAWVLAIGDEARGGGGNPLYWFDADLNQIWADPCDTLDEAKVEAEKDYAGIHAHWIEVKT